MNDNAWDKTPIRIPSPWNVNSFADKNGLGGDFRAYPSYPKEWENIKMGWLRKTFNVAKSWSGKRILLHFEAVAGDAEIILNGKAVGKHFGIFLPFDVDVTDAIQFGKENELCIGVRKPSLSDRRSDFGRRTYQAGSFWGQHVAGIWQDVFLVAVPDVHVSDVYIKPLLDKDQLEAAITISNDRDKEAQVSIGGTVLPWKNGTKAALALPAVSVKVPAHGGAKLVLTAKVAGALKEWSATSPNLYNLLVQTTVDGKPIDSKDTRFGWRQVTFKGNQFLLNGKPFIMRGDSWHFLGIPQMTRRYAEAWYKAMRDANVNAVRLHAEPYPSFYMDVADEMGILVLDETAVWASDGGPKLNDSNYWKDSERHLSELVLRDRNHPSVFGWSVSNEVKPIVRGVMRNPPGMMDTLVKYYGVWADICRQLDPSRPWISADGEDDGEGKLPTYVVHYGGFDAMNRASKNGKPWGVGEAGNAYYGTPEQVAETNGARAYESFLGRMEGVAASSYQSLVAQKERNAVYQSVFNLVWYGLKPLALGMKDTTRPPALTDGIFFTQFKEGQPGVQPERLGPYCTTLNPGYDPSLPLYETWPLFDAISDAGSDKATGDRWKNTKTVVAPAPVVKAVTGIHLLAGARSTLARDLKRTGVPVDKTDNMVVPDLLLIDGAHPPAADAKAVIEKVYAKGGTVFVWGTAADQLTALNQLLPAPLTLTSRAASSLLTVKQNTVVAGITAPELYFSELRPAEIITQGLAGALVKQSDVLLEACNTDWLLWNKQPEYAKTAMVYRSERETKASGVALIEKKMGNGRLLVTTLPAAPRLAKAEKAIRKILANIGVTLGTGSDAGKPLLKGGDIVRVLLCGSFPIASMQEGTEKNWIDPAAGESIRANTKLEGKAWNLSFNESGLFDITKEKIDGPRYNATAYMSFWVSSPRNLDDLLIEPNIPVVNMEIASDDAAQVWLNGKKIINNGQGKAEALKLHQGWNHFLIKVIQTGGGWQFSGRLTCNQPEFLAELESALEKP
jgi:beta-galactosidase